MLDRFGSDVRRLTNYGTNLKEGALGKALIDVAIADYYFMQSGFTKDFYNAITGGIGFDLKDIGADWASNKTVRQLGDVIATQLLNGDQEARAFLAQDNYWSIQSGDTAINATGTGSNNDAMIGGSGSDTLDGGEGNDFLYGNDGADTLTGGAGKDLLIGGVGADTLDGGSGYDSYVIEGIDTIQDSDGKGLLRDKAGNVISGAILKRADGSYVYLSDPGIGVTLDSDLTLTLANGSVAKIKNYRDGDLALQLVDTAQASTTLTINGDISPTDINPSKAGIQAEGDAQGNPIGTSQPYEDILGGSAGNDHILSGALNDDIGGDAGDDWIEGGSGNDYIGGRTGNDILEGGAGSDILIGEEGNDRLYANAQMDTTTAIDNGNNDTGSGQKGDWLTGNVGDDTLVAGGDNDVLAGGAGADLLIAGAGDDNILGDADYVAQFLWEATPRYSIGSTDWYHSSADTFNWTVTPGADSTVFAPVVGETNPAGGGADTIYAGAGDDHVWAGEGDDVVYGEGGNDTISGEAGNDILDGGADNDTLFGGADNDYLDGGDGNDTLWGGIGDDSLYGGSGDDKLYGETGANYLDGEDGDDILNSGGPGSELFAGAGNDDISAAGGGNYLDGEDGNDTLAADGGNNTLFGGAGNDSLSASGGNNYLDGEEGNNTLSADGGGNTLFAGAGNDTLSAGGGNNYLDGGAGTNTLIADGGGNTLFGGTGNDTLSSAGGGSYLVGGDGDDTLIVDGGGNTLVGGAGDDGLYGGDGADTLSGGAGIDRIQSGGGDDNASGGEGDDLIFGEAGDDILAGDAGIDELQGGDGLDRLDGGDGDDILFGQAGNDTIFGGAGGDYLEGGVGADYLAGGEDFDVYFYRPGDGVDTIVDSGYNALSLAYFMSPGLFQLRVGSLMLDFGNGDAIHLEGFDPSDPYTNQTGITEFRFLNTTLSYADVIDLGFDLRGTPEADVIEGTGANDRIDALESDDVVIGYAGNDTIDLGSGDDIANAGEGDDIVTAGEGADIVFGGAGEDVIAGDEGDDQLFGEDGADSLDGGSGDDQLFGGDGNDWLYGGEGTDTLAGGAGDDTFVIDDDLDTIFENADEGYDVIESSISLTITENVEELLLTGDEDLTGTGNALDNVISGNDGDNLLLGLEGDDHLDGGWGDDLLDGGAGADVMAGGMGDDLYIVDDAGDRVVEVQDGYDRHLIYDPFPNVVGYGELAWSGGYDTVEASVSFALDQWTEQLVLTGSDAINGVGNVEANYIEGNDADNALYAYRTNGRTDLYPTGIPLMQQFSLLTVRNAAEEMLADKANAAIFRAEFPWFLPQQVELYAGQGDEIYGWGGNDRLYGGLDNDSLYGGEGDDLLYGFAGGDYMAGGAGDDTYVVSGRYEFLFGYQGGDRVSYLDDSQDELYEADSEGTDTVVSEVNFALPDNIENLTLVFDTRDYDPDGQVSMLRFSGAIATVGEGNSLDNVITGSDIGNSLFGYEGSDTLIGGLGNDYLDGGEGADAMAGGGSDDTYLVNEAGDVVSETAGSGIDEVRSMIDYTLTANVENLYLMGETFTENLRGTGNELDNLIVGNDGDNTLSGRAGNDTLDGGYGADVMTGGAGDDVYYVENELDVTTESANKGHDTVYSSIDHTLGANIEDLYLTGDANTDGKGNELDNLIVGNDGNNVLKGHDGDDVIRGREGRDSIDGGKGDDQLFGGRGNDDISGGAGKDLLRGGRGDDLLYGDRGDDLLDGGRGADWMEGGAGDDTYYMDDYNDRIVENVDEGIDTVYESLSYYEMFGINGANVENATVLGEFQDIDVFDSWTVYGNELDNIITGNDGDNWLSGNDGADTIDGRAGGDSISGDNGDDVIYGGADAVRYASNTIYIDSYGDEVPWWWGDGKPVTRTVGELASNSDNLYGGDGNDALDGGAGDDDLYGDDGDDYLYGGDDGLVADAFADGGEGGGGEGEGGGETEDGGVFLSNNDYLDGGSGDDVLDGGSGNDDLYGGDGDDTLYGGTDGPLNRTGRDYLDGGAGIDFMAGGTDDDTYIVDGYFHETTDIPVYDDCGELIPGAVTRVWTTDTVLEYADEGYDYVYSYADFTLPDNVERLDLAWYSDALIGRGNSSDNYIYGNNWDNRLEGGDGDDTLVGYYGNDVLDGGGGDDVLYGYEGDDVYNFGVGSGHDTVYSYGGGFDSVHLIGDVSADDVVLSRQGNDVVVGLAGSGDRMVLSNWFGSPSERVRQIVFCDDPAWNETTIAALANARVDMVVANFDVATAQEDASSPVNGNVLDNDVAVDLDATLSVGNPGNFDGGYGALALVADGRYAYTLDNGSGAVQSLAEGEYAYDSFGYEAVDGSGAFANAYLQVAIAGQNDAPEFGPAGSGAVTEDQSVTESFVDDSILYNGSFDYGLYGWEVAGNSDYADYDFLAVDGDTAAYFGAIGSPTILGQSVWTEEGQHYLLDFFLQGGGANDASVSVLWNGEEVFALANTTLDDYTQYQVELTGIEGESRLEFALRDDPGYWHLDGVTLGLFEEETFVPYFQSTDGTVAFTDVDLSDGHGSYAEPQGTDYLGYFESWVESDSTYGGSGSVGWYFEVENDAIQYLAEGETLEQGYAVTVNDAFGGSDTETVSVTITGVNDTPEAYDIAAVAGEDGPAVNLEPNYYDVDLADTHAVSVSSSDNAGFERGDFVGWELSDYALGGIVFGGAPDGGRYASLWSGDGQDEYTRLSRTVSLAAGERLSGFAEFIAGDELPHDDDAYVAVRLAGGAATSLFSASVGSVGDYGDTGWVPFEFVAPEAGTYVLEAGVRNVEDNSADSQLLLDGIEHFRPAAGVTLNADGTFDYDPGGRFEWLAVGETATEVLTYTVTDNHGGQASATATVEIVGANDAPEIGAGAIEATVTEDNGQSDWGTLSADGMVAFADVDLSDGHDLGIAALATDYVGYFDAWVEYDSTGTGAGSIGWYFEVENDILQYLAEGETLEQGYELTVDDGYGGSDTRTVSITIAGANDAPEAEDIAATVGEDGPAVTLTPLYFDADESDTHVIAVGAFGNTGFEQGGLAGWTLSDAALGEVVQGGAPLGDSYASLSSGAGQDAYSTLARTFTLAAGEAISGLAEFVAGDALPYDDDGYVSIRLLGGATTLLFNASVASVGDYGDTGWVSYEFIASEAGNYVLEAGVRNAQDNSVDSHLLLDGAEPLRPAAGVTLNADGTFDYDPGGRFEWLAEGETATDLISYTVTDDHGAQAVATATVEIVGANDAPEIGAAVTEASVTEDNALPASAVLGAEGAIAFSDVDLSDVHEVQVGTLDSGYLGEFSAQLVADSAGGGAGGVQWSFSVNNGELDALGEGETLVQYYEVLVDDGHGGIDERIVTVTLNGVNDAPVANNDAGAAQEDGGPVTLLASTLLDNDTDVDAGDTKTISAVTNSAAGAQVTLADGNAVYDIGNLFQTLKAGATATDTFSYTMVDAAGVASSATVTMTITGANDAPVAQGDASAAQEDGGPVTLSGALLLDNDIDVDIGDSKSIVAVTNSAAGAQVALVGGDVVYDVGGLFQSLGQDAITTDTFSYTMIDGAGAMSTATVTMTITGMNDAPVTQDDAASVQEDGDPATGNVLANDDDVDDGTTLTVANAGQYGSLALSANGDYTYTLDNASSAVQGLRQGEVVRDSFTYFADDGITSTEGALVVSITGANDTPVANADTGAAQEDGPAVTLLASSLLANDTDVDAGDTKAIIAVTNSAAGAQVTLTGGNAVYNIGGLFQTLKAGATTTDSFTYTMLDGAGAASTASVTMTITGVNDAPVLVNLIPDQNAAAGTAFNFVFAAPTFNDIDIGDTLSYSATQADGTALPSWLLFNAATRTFSGTPPGGSGGTGGGTGGDCGCGTGGGTVTDIVQIRVLATDTAGASATDQFALNISGVTGGSGIVPIVGTDHDDVIAGTSGNDVIDGRKGYDRMSGGAGDDVYFVDQTSGRVDLVTEGAVAGYDTVYSSANYTLGSNLEELHLIGSDNLQGRGNSLANMVIGNSGDNRLYGEAGNDLLLDDAGDDLLDGGAGDDVLDGGAGNDTLVGGAGNDLFVHTTGGGDDVVQDSGGADAIRFGAGITAGNVTVGRSSNDLVLRLSGGNGRVTAKDWFASAAKRVEQVQFADGTTWNEAAIRARVTAGSGSGSGSDGHDGGSSGGGSGSGGSGGSSGSGGYGGGDDGHSNNCGSGNQGGGHEGGDGHDGDHHDEDGYGSNEMRDAIAARLKRDPNYDFTALAAYLQRQNGGGYGAMTPQQIAQRWMAVQNCVASLAQMDDHDGHGGHGGDHHDGGSGSGDGHSNGGWGYSGSTGQNRGCGGMDGFSGLGEGFRRL